MTTTESCLRPDDDRGSKFDDGWRGSGGACAWWLKDAVGETRGNDAEILRDEEETR